ncbi:MAG TPA: HAMP domain-containing protein, partial [Rhodocyclaceae bacterium]|nr:HAMP domain-containing protein [Rhodocyclaceae bacterium]
MKNLKIGIRLGIGFAVVLLLLLITAVMGSLRLQALQAEISDLVTDKNVKVAVANEIVNSVNELGLQHRNMMIPALQSETALQGFLRATADERQKIVKGLEKLDGLSYGSEGEQLLDQMKSARQTFIAIQQNFEALIQQRNFDRASEVFPEYRAAYIPYRDALTKFIDYQTNLSMETGKIAEAQAEQSVMLLLSLLAVALVIGIVFAIFITRSITRPVSEVSAAAKKMAQGDFNFDLKSDAKDEVGEVVRAVADVQASVRTMIADAGMLSDAAVAGKLATRADASRHQGDFRKIVQGVNDTLDAVIGPLNVAATYVDQIAKGAIPPRITDTYNGDFNTIKNNLNTAIDAVNALVADAGMLSRAAVEGKLATRADASKHQGDYARIVQGVNDTLDAVIGPLNVAASYVDQIAKGAIPAKITDSYNGDFNTIKNNLNTCIDAVNELVADAVMLAQAAVEGRLQTRADASKHQGDYRRIVEGVNATLDAVIAPINEVKRVMVALSGGDLTQKITDDYAGDFQV